MGAISAEGQWSDLGSLYDTPTESDLPSVAHIAVPDGTALVHQPTTETGHPSGLSEEDRAAILARAGGRGGDRQGKTGAGLSQVPRHRPCRAGAVSQAHDELPWIPRHAPQQVRARIRQVDTGSAASGFIGD